MATIRLVVSTSKKRAELVSAALFEAGAQGLEERPGRGATLVTYAETKKELASLWKRAAQALEATLGPKELPQVTLEEADESWRTAWTAHLGPVQLTPRFVLAPTSAPEPQLGRNQQLIVYEPALAFGDGDHPTTRLAARAIELHYRKTPGGALLDIGAGTGVLSFVAVASGAARALGTDVDAEAVRAATTNAQLNGVSRRVRFVSATGRVAGNFDLVVVNIELRPLLAVLGALPAAARRAPKLLVTGFLDTQLEDVRAAVKAAGFAPRRPVASGGDAKGRRAESWLLLEGRR